MKIYSYIKILKVKMADNHLQLMYGIIATAKSGQAPNVMFRRASDYALNPP